MKNDIYEEFDLGKVVEKFYKEENKSPKYYKLKFCIFIITLIIGLFIYLK